MTRPPTITATYEQGDIIDVMVNLTANHGGFFVFQLCTADDPLREVDEECLNGRNLQIVREQPADDSAANSIEANLNVLAIAERNESEAAKDERNRIDDSALLTNLTEESYESFDSLEATGEASNGELDNGELGNEIDLHLNTSLLIKSRYNLFNPVDLDDHTYDRFKFQVPFESPRSYAIKVKLSNEISCERCVLRWIYVGCTGRW